jgi:hypothetical protein
MFTIVFGLIQLFVGVYGLASALKMKNKRIVSGGFLPRSAKEAACTDIDSLIRYLFSRQLVFSSYCVVNGVLTVLHEQYGILQGGLELTLSLLFLLFTFYFSMVIRKAIRTYF